jgi:hypothetical protein
VYVLVHSPLVGPLTWSLVAAEMRQRGLDIFVPHLRDLRAADIPFWKQHAESASEALAQVPKGTFLTLVAHSGAGPLLPAIRRSIASQVSAYVFVDAGIPRDGASRLELMKSEDPEWAAQFEAELERGERFPDWSVDDLREVIPDESLRRQLVAEIRPRELSFFTEPIPVFEGWPDAPCIYIQFSAAYDRPAAQAEQADWQVHKLEVGHFHMLVDPKTVTDIIINAAPKQF